MFNKELFSGLLNKVKGPRSINKFASVCGVSAAHISRLMRSMIDVAPSPKVINKFFSAGEGRVTYEELMEAAGHLKKHVIKNSDEIPDVMKPFIKHNSEITIFCEEDGESTSEERKKSMEEAIKKINALDSPFSGLIDLLPEDKRSNQLSLYDLLFIVGNDDRLMRKLKAKEIEEAIKYLIEEFPKEAKDEAIETYKVDPDLFTQMCRAKDLPEPERQKIKEYAAFILEKYLKESPSK